MLNLFKKFHKKSVNNNLNVSNYHKKSFFDSMKGIASKNKTASINNDNVRKNPFKQMADKFFANRFKQKNQTDGKNSFKKHSDINLATVLKEKIVGPKYSPITIFKKSQKKLAKKIDVRNKKEAWLDKEDKKLQKLEIKINVVNRISRFDRVKNIQKQNKEIDYLISKQADQIKGRIIKKASKYKVVKHFLQPYDNNKKIIKPPKIIKKYWMEFFITFVLIIIIVIIIGILFGTHVIK